MNIIILHGEDTHKSYSRLTTFMETAKKRGWEILDFDLSSIQNQSLFGEERFYILRDYKLLTKEEITQLDKYSGNLIIYHSGNIPVTFTKLLPKNTKFEKFDIPKLIFKFLDNITLRSFHEIIKTEPVEFVFSMIAWKYKKKYTTNPTREVGSIINKLAQIDIDSKTGKADLTLSLDLLIAKDLE